MRIVVFGESGQLARALAASIPCPGEVMFLDRAACDLLEPGAVAQVLERYQPQWVINAAGYTAVDLAESEPELAYRVNAAAVGEMAAWVTQNDARFIHVSTDFVFDGEQRQPYLPGDAASPIGEYGRSKHAGERLALEQAPEHTMIIRTSWVYYEQGQNFVKTMLRLMAERDALNVVSDQIGSPTYAGSLAAVIWSILTLDRFSPGIYHWTDAGNISWHEFAEVIQAEAVSRGLLARSVPVHAISASEYPTPAARPAYSVLDTTKLERLLETGAWPWKAQLEVMLDTLSAT